MSSIRLREVGQSARIPSSFTTTGSTRAGTSLPGNSRRSSPKKFARPSGRCVATDGPYWARDAPAVPKEKPMTGHAYDKEITALLVIDPYNDFISEGGK